MSTDDVTRVEVYFEGATFRLETLAQLDRLFDRITRSGTPVIVTVTSREGHRLSIGLGRASSPLFFERPGFAALRSACDVPAGPEQSFQRDGLAVPIPARALIDAERARACVRRFFESGTLPPEIAWEEV